MADWLSALIQGASTLGGALLSSNANQGAASTAAGANTEAAQIYANAQKQASDTYAAAQQKGLDAYTTLVNQAIAEAKAYNETAKGTYGTLAAESQPAVDYMRSVAFSNPYTLTPQQQTARDATMRSAGANLAASGLRGAGRSGQAILNKAGQDFDNSAWASNRTRADSAGNQLFGTNVAAEDSIAATDRSTGATGANLLSGEGTAAMTAAGNTGNFAANAAANTGSETAALTRDTGQTTANAGLADANVWGSAIGALSSIINGDIKGRNVYGSGGSGSGY